MQCPPYSTEIKAYVRVDSLRNVGLFSLRIIVSWQQQPLSASTRAFFSLFSYNFCIIVAEDVTLLTFAPIPELSTRLKNLLKKDLTEELTSDEMLILPAWYSSPMTLNLQNSSIVMIRGPRDMQILKKSRQIQWYKDVKHCVN